MGDGGDLLYLANKLKDIFQCPKCQKELEPPISQCVAGHEICSQCKQSACPFCSADFAVSSKLTEQVFKLHPKPCKFSDLGCSDVSVAGRHEGVCKFRAFKCPMVANSPCTWSGTFGDWKSHVPAKHRGEKMVIFDNWSAKVGKYMSDYFNEPWNNDCFYLEKGKHIFLFFMLNKCGEVRYGARYVPAKSTNNYEYYIQVAICQNDKAMHKCAVKVSNLDENELLEDICQPCGVFFDGFGIDNLFGLKMKFQIVANELNKPKLGSVLIDSTK